MAAHILAMDQGTTSSRAFVFSETAEPLSVAQAEFEQIFPHAGWVEHDPRAIWATSLDTARQAIIEAGLRDDDIAAIGITNQRETTLIWDRKTGEPVYNAIVWQDRRTADLCARLKADGHEAMVTGKTGLVLDPYFSATKIAWMLTHVEGARARAEAGELAFGTVESWLIWNLTGGTSHVMDITNAARTLLFNIDTLAWDEELCALFGVPAALLPEVKDNCARFGETLADHFGRPIPITGSAGDQQAASIGQACFEPGMLKSTYGTGCFALLNTGETRAHSENRLLGTIASRFEGTLHYALEGSIFMAGATIQWLRDGLGLIGSATESEALAKQASDEPGVYLVPAFVGLGAPHWDAGARGALVGLTRDTGKAEIVRAAIEAVCFQTRELMEAMARDRGAPPEVLRVDGGMVVNDWMVQRLADLTGLAVERPRITETTALGAAYLAGLETGLFSSRDQIAEGWAREALFEPKMSVDERETRFAGWMDAVNRTLSAT